MAIIVTNGLLHLLYQRWQLVIITALLLIPWLLVLLFNHRHLFHVSKAITVITAGFTITFLSYLYSFSSGISIYYVASAVGSFCLYSYEEKRALLLNTLFYLVLFSFTAIFFNHEPILSDLSGPQTMMYFQYSSFVFSLILTSFFIHFLNTENKQIEKALIGEKEKAEKADQAKSRFLSMMSHEIRTPISAILGFTELLKQENDAQKKELYLQNIGVSGGNLLDIVNEILDLSALENGQIKYQPSSFSILQLLEEMESTFKPIAIQKGLNFELQSSGQLEFHHITDRKLLNQVLTNLIQNAIKFTIQGGVKLLLVAGKPDKYGISNIQIHVQDTGIGFSPGDSEIIFKRFAQVSEDINRTHGGTGLGLYIVKELLKILGGDIKAESTPGKGSDFKLTLRLNTLAPKQDSKEEKEETKFDKFIDKHVLLAEDDPFNAMITRHLLEEWDIHVSHALNGIEAMDMAQKSAFNLILMDIQMPECDGIQATQGIRNQSSGLNIETPIVGYTANISLEERKLGTQCGMNDYLIKPVSKELLYQSLKKLMT